MQRVRRPFARPASYRDATLIVVACEGACDEPAYFEAMRLRLGSQRLRVEVLRREEAGNSAPEHVLRMLDGYAKEYDIDADDQLWLVVDRDAHSWKAKQLAEVCKTCLQKRYRTAVSNPSFEVWLLLHCEGIEIINEYFKQTTATAAKFKTYVARHRRDRASADAWYDHLFAHMQTAISRAQTLEKTVEAGHRWPQSVGTHVHRLAAELRRIAGDTTGLSAEAHRPKAVRRKSVAGGVGIAKRARHKKKADGDAS